MTRGLISSGSRFEEEMAYSRAVVVGKRLYVSGTTGYNYQEMTISDDVAVQADQTFRNIADALQRAGFRMGDIVRVRYTLPNAGDFPACFPAMQRYLGHIKPAATMLVCGLVDPLMKIEIEVDCEKS